MVVRLGEPDKIYTIVKLPIQNINDKIKTDEYPEKIKFFNWSLIDFKKEIPFDWRTFI